MTGAGAPLDPLPAAALAALAAGLLAPLVPFFLGLAEAAAALAALAWLPHAAGGWAVAAPARRRREIALGAAGIAGGWSLFLTEPSAPLVGLALGAGAAALLLLPRRSGRRGPFG